MLEASNAEDTNRKAANSLDCRLIESKNKLKDLEIKMEKTNAELYETKAERNNLLTETFNLRKDNKELREKVGAQEKNHNQVSDQFQRLENTLADLEANNNSGGFNQEIALTESPSAMTALNTLRNSYTTNYTKKHTKIQVESN